MEDTFTQEKRIQNMKRIIMGAAVLLILVPAVISIVLGIRVAELSERIEELQALLDEEKETAWEASSFSVSHIEESSRNPGGKETPGRAEAQEISEAQEMSEGEKSIYLTFDDGPSSNTNAILDILKEYDVKATFFVTGKTDEASKEAYRRIAAEGHTLAMHSYSHKYDEIYQSKESFTADLSKLQEYLYELTDVWPRFYRFPGGSSNTVSNVDMQELIAWMNENGISYYDWNIVSGDAVSTGISKEVIVDNCLSGIEAHTECMILMHDASSKGATVEALPEIISQARLRGDVRFYSITDETRPIQHVQEHTEEDS